MTLTVDSSVFIAALREQEAKHSVCLRLLERIKNGEFVAVEPCTVLVEVSAAIRRRTGSEDLAREVKSALSRLHSVRFVDLDVDERAEEAAEIAVKTALRGMDAIVAQTAMEFDAVLVTLDGELAERASSVARVEPPEELI